MATSCGARRCLLLEPIVLGPAKRDEVVTLLGQIGAIEAENTFIAMAYKQFAARTPMDLAPVLATLEASEPRVAAELRLRMERKHVLPFETVKEQWPATQERLLSAWQQSVDENAPLVGLKGKRIVKPVIGGSATGAQDAPRPARPGRGPVQVTPRAPAAPEGSSMLDGQ